MGNIFAGSEVVELGIQIEKNGRDYYRALAARSKNQNAVKVFSYLAGEEEKHIVVFQKILEKLAKYEPAPVYADDYIAYMNALASEHIFTQKNKGEEAARQTTSDRDAIDRGISFEKDSIVFYVGIKGVVPEYDQGVVDELIAQEQTHLRQLVDLKQKGGL